MALGWPQYYLWPPYGQAIKQCESQYNIGHHNAFYFSVAILVKGNDGYNEMALKWHWNGTGIALKWLFWCCLPVDAYYLMSIW